MTKNNKKLLTGIVILVVAIVALGFAYKTLRPSTTEGAKSITIEVVDDQGESTSYEVHTDAEYLRQAMDEADGLTYEGTDSEYGLMVETVNGVEAIYDNDGAYWAFYVNDEYCNYGVDEQPVEDGDAFRIEYTAGQ